METVRIVEPFPAKENPSKTVMATSTNSSNQHLRFDPKFNHLPAPSDDRLDSGVDSYRSIESCPSGGLEQFEDAFQKMQLSSTSEETEEIKQKSAEEQDSQLFLTEDAFDQDQEGDTPLHMAIIHENEAAYQFIHYAPSVQHLNIANNLSQTPLHLAVHTKQHKVCRALVVAGASLDIVDRHGNTALHIACINGSTECAKALTMKIMKEEITQHQRLQHNVVHVNQVQDLELRNFDGLTCMHLAAAASGNFHLVCYLRSIGAQVDAPDGKSGRTALHYAVEANNFNLVQYLITLGANVNALTFDFCTPLHLAIGRGLQRIVLLLLDNGADVNVSNLEDLRPADLAADQNQLRFLHEQPEYNDFQIQGM